jgi:hypothetical protein
VVERDMAAKKLGDVVFLNVQPMTTHLQNLQIRRRASFLLLWLRTKYLR